MLSVWAPRVVGLENMLLISWLGQPDVVAAFNVVEASALEVAFIVQPDKLGQVSHCHLSVISHSPLDERH